MSILDYKTLKIIINITFPLNYAWVKPADRILSGPGVSLGA